MYFDERPLDARFSGSLSFPFHSNFKDISDSEEEEETNTIKPASPVYHQKLDDLHNNILKSTSFSSTAKKDTEVPESPKQMPIETGPDDVHIQPSTAKVPYLLPLTLVFTPINYVALNLGLSNSGPISQITLVLSSIFIGYTIALNHVTIVKFLKNMYSIPGLTNLIILGLTTYYSNYLIGYTFDSLYFIHMNIPIFGGLVVISVLGMIAVLVLVVGVVRCGWIVSDVVERRFKGLGIGLEVDTVGCGETRNRLRRSSDCMSNYSRRGSISSREGLTRSSMESLSKPSLENLSRPCRDSWSKPSRENLTKGSRENLKVLPKIRTRESLSKMRSREIFRPWPGDEDFVIQRRFGIVND